MIVRLLLIGAAALLLFAALRWFMRTPPAVVARTLRRAALYGAVAVLVLLAATGRLNWLFALIGSLLALLPRILPYLPVLGRLYNKSRARGARPSRLETRRLRMTLDPATGTLDGVVLEGRFTGARLSALTVEDLIALWRECQEDEESAGWVAAYLDRMRGKGWRAQTRGSGTGANKRPSESMTPAEAYQILGLEPGAGKDEIIQAHRRLMQKLHPDRGGSGYLAAKLNQAKERLLGH